MVAVVETRVMSIVRLREAEQRLIWDVKEIMMLLMMVAGVIGVAAVVVPEVRVRRVGGGV